MFPMREKKARLTLRRYGLGRDARLALLQSAWSRQASTGNEPDSPLPTQAMHTPRLKLLRAILVSGSLVNVASPGHAQNPDAGPYLYLDAGVTVVQDIDNNMVAGFPGTVKLNPGFRLSIGPGYTFWASPAFEVAVQFETGFTYNSLDTVSGGDFSLKGEGEMYQIPFLADIICRFRFGSRLMPFIGVGGGGVYSKLTIDSLQGEPFNVSGGETDGAVQAMAGVTYRFNARNELGLGYKFLATFPDYTDYIGTHSFSLVYVLRF